MKFIKSKDLLILLIGLFILQSCKKEGDLGLEKQIDEEGLYGTLVDSHSIRLFSVKDDSLIGSNLVRNQVGDFQDPLFGRTQAAFAFHATLPKNNVDFGTGLVLDSIVLVMAYPVTKADRFYGDSSSRFELKLFQLDEDISNDSNYYTNKVFRTKSVAIGTLNYQARPDDSITIQNIRVGKADTIAKIYPHLRMRLENSFGQELLSKSGQTDLSSSAAFLSAYKGFYLTANRLSGDGGILSYDLTNTNRSYIVMYYRTSTDTTNFVFNINSGSANVNYYKHDYTGTEIQNQLSDSSLGNTKVFVQSLAGLRGKLQFPTLSSLLDSGAIAINKAELIIKPVAGTTSQYAPFSTISVKGRYENNTEILLNTASYSSSKNEYKVDLTRSIQFIIDKKLKFKEFYIEDNSKQINPKRTLISGINSADPIKLRIFYTKLY